jgi:3-oxoacyl-[acyl-carrier-protein] synthase-3
VQSAQFISTGMAVPERVVTNFDLEKIVDTSDQWIFERTGMKERRIGGEGVAASDLALQAARQALDAAGLAPTDLDAILVATISGDYIWPSTACVLQNRLGANNVMAVDLSAACSGFIYGLSVAQAYIASGRYKTILLVGVDMLTKTVDWSDRTSCVLFGDGAGAVILQARDAGKGVIDTVLGADGSAADLLCIPGGGSRMPMTEEVVQKGKHFLHIEGRKIYKHAVKAMAQATLDVLARAGKTLQDVNLIVPHQANVRIIEGVAQRLELSMDCFYLNIHKYANTSAATIPIAIHEARQEGRIKDGDLILVVAFGGGLTWGAGLIQF